MKKLAKSTVAIITVISVLVVTILTLGLISVRQDKYFFEGYEYFQVYKLGSSTALPIIDEQVSSKLSSVRFSVLEGMLEGQYGYSPSIVKDSDGDPVYLSSSTLKGLGATTDKYLLHFIYSSTKSITVEGNKYEYNRAYVFIQEGNGSIVEVRVIPYVFENAYNDSDNIHYEKDGGVIPSELYEIADLRIKMRTSKLFASIENAVNKI